MNQEKISSGIVFILIGVIVLLMNFRVIDWSIFSVLFVLWPLFFVVIGINIIFGKVPFIKIGVWVTFVIVLIYFTINIDSYPFIKKSQFNYYVPITYTKVESKEYISEFRNIQTAELQFDVGLAGDVTVRKNDSDELANVMIPGKFSSYTETQIGNTAKLRIADNQTPTPVNEDGLSYDLMLNPDTVWDLSFKTGIISATLDLEDILIDHLSVQTGAGDINIKIGRVTDQSSIYVASGVANLTLEVASSIGVSVSQKTVISDSNFKEGWHKKGNTYYSNNYDDAKSKVDISIESAVSSVDIFHE
jgi:hypothetical protein